MIGQSSFNLAAFFLTNQVLHLISFCINFIFTVIKPGLVLATH